MFQTSVKSEDGADGMGSKLEQDSFMFERTFQTSDEHRGERVKDTRCEWSDIIVRGQRNRGSGYR